MQNQSKHSNRKTEYLWIHPIFIELISDFFSLQQRRRKWEKKSFPEPKRKKGFFFIFHRKEKFFFCDTNIDVYEMYVQVQRVCIISRLRGLCTFLLTLLLYWKCLIFPVYLFLYSYNYASQPNLEYVCVYVYVYGWRLCHDCVWTRTTCTEHRREKELLVWKMRMYVFVVIPCCWLSCICNTIPIAAA